MSLSVNKYAVIIAAGGIGQRFGRAGGKQLFKYKGKPIIIHTVQKFIDKVAQIVIVIKKEDQKKLREYLKKYKITVDSIVNSGKERVDSVKNGLAVLKEGITHVLIHDGARPNITPELIEKIKHSLLSQKAVIPVLPVADTIKIIRAQQVIQTPKRSELFQVQTPQGFKKDLINKAYNEVDLEGCTDDAMVVERYGQPVTAIPGDLSNIKLTSFADLRYLS